MLDRNWKEKFNDVALEQGKERYLGNRVADLKKDGDRYSAGILGRQRQNVSLILKDGKPIRMTCQCPMAKSGGKCGHMAALLYALEAQFHPEDDPKRIAEKERQNQQKALILQAEKAKKREEQKKKKQLEEEQRKQEQLRQQEEEHKKQEQLRRQEEERKKQEQQRLWEEMQQIEREKRREEREKRKAEKARKEAEQKKKVQEELQRQREKIQAESERREAIRQQKKAEKQKKMEKKEQNAMEYTSLNEQWRDKTEQNVEMKKLAALEEYHYFDADRIIESAEIPEQVWQEGQMLLNQGKMNTLSITTGYDGSGQIDEQIGQAEATEGKGRNQFSVTVLFDRNELLNLNCECPECHRKYYYRWGHDTSSECRYVAALLLGLKQALKKSNTGDATDRDANQFLMRWQKRENRQLLTEQLSKENSLELQPRLVKKNGDLTVSFKFGTGKLFVVKSLSEFCNLVKNAETATYGQDTVIRHIRENFTSEGQKWLQFIEQIVQEESEIARYYLERRNPWDRYHFRNTVAIGGDLNIFGWRLDAFYQMLGESTVAYEDRDQVKTQKSVLHCEIENPSFKLKITENMTEGNRKKNVQFHGICAQGTLPELFFGMQHAYFIDGQRLCRTDEEFREKIEPFMPMVDEDGNFSFKIGRNNMSEFYYQILPNLEEIAEIEESDPERFHSYLPPKVHFVFYLDAPDGDAVCRIMARYGECTFPVIGKQKEKAENWRDVNTEERVVFRARQWLPYVNERLGELNCGRDEEKVFQLMGEGVEDLMTLGEVQCTNRFRARRVVHHVKVSVGVSVSEGMLNLDITTDDIPREELLDILNSYRRKQRYHRLKDGSYVELEDHSLEMLAELMDSMQMKPKEFVDGKMHLPLYRSLYLNKMLEEDGEIYSDRDSHFRKIVKAFKTVEDADYEIPSGLSRIMRNYQKNGYKWMRTLAERQFGGILADDMGLGKTLQMMAVLLAAKLENTAEHIFSLVVSPASLVFNWGEEFSRFAPELKVCLVTGTQTERQKMIDSYQDYDVLVTSYDLLKRDIHLYEKCQFEYQVIDEAQYIKNHTIAAAKAVKVIKSIHRFALTGTPIENRLSELWSIFDYLMPGFLYTYEAFRKEMETPIAKHQDKQALARLQKMTAPFILRRRKEDVLKDLPEKLEEVRYVRLEGEQQKLYDGQVLHMQAMLAEQSGEEFNRQKLLLLAELTHLRQICCDPALCFEQYQGEAAKLEACLELIKSAIDGGHRILLFSQFTSMLEIVKQKLAKEGVDHYTITGATPKEERLQLVKKFNTGSVPVFLISLKAGGVGLNLTGADVVIHYDPWWNLAAQNQATDRAHRIGQTKKVTVYKLIAKNTVEEKILKLQETKKDLADQVINGTGAGLSGMSKEELLELLEI